MFVIRLARSFLVSVSLGVLLAAATASFGPYSDRHDLAVEFAAPVFAQSGSSYGAPSISCDALTSRTFPNATITVAQSAPAGTFTPSDQAPTAKPNQSLMNLPAFCRVAATLKPSADSDIKMEALAAGGELERQASGCRQRGLGGINQLCRDGRSPQAGVRDELNRHGTCRRRRTVDATARKARRFRVPRHSRDDRDQQGHRRGLLRRRSNASRTSTDAPAAGARGWSRPSASPTTSTASSPAHRRSTRRAAPPSPCGLPRQCTKTNSPTFLQASTRLVHDAVLTACDAADGVKDGVLEDPKQCRFDPAVLACTAGDSPNCLTAAQVESARKNYAALVHAGTRREISPGLMPGSELGWATYGSPQPFGLGAQMYQHMVFKDPKWDYKTLNFDRDMALTDKIENGVIDVRAPDLKRYFDRGGKIIHYHGWADPQITPMSSVKYYEGVLESTGGAARVNDSYRLFMVPGMATAAAAMAPARST